MSNFSLLGTTAPIGGVTPAISPWAGPNIRIATPDGARVTPAQSASAPGIRWPDALGD